MIHPVGKPCAQHLDLGRVPRLKTGRKNLKSHFDLNVTTKLFYVK